MKVPSPTFTDTFVIADDVELAARVACILAKRGQYLPIIDGPRMARMDRDAEVIRRVNAVARAAPKRVIMAGLTQDATSSLTRLLSRKLLLQAISANDFDQIVGPDAPLLCWGREHIGIGLLQALRSGRLISFDEGAPTCSFLPSAGTHLVVCEEGYNLAEIIAANYAFSLNAGLKIIPPIDETQSTDLLEAYYSLNEYRDSSQSERLSALADKMRTVCGRLEIPADGSITFVTEKLPLGTGFPNVPCTHLFTYPDLGIAIINGFAAEQPRTRGVNVAVLVDPGTTDAAEIEAAQKLLPARGILVRTYKGPGATVRTISQMIENFPYDLLILATHCGDVSGYRWTYEFIDSEGIQRTLVVDLAVGFGQTDDPEILEVTQFMRFRQLDGVDWSDPVAKRQLYVGTAIKDFIERERESDEWEPVRKETIDRVFGSAALSMFDHNYLPIPRSLANENTPIILNNACASWQELAQRFVFGNARAYIGSLFPITSAEAAEVTIKLLDKHSRKFLPHALWSAQNAVYGASPRRPYVMTGVYTQRIRSTKLDAPALIKRQLQEGALSWKRNLSRVLSRKDEKLEKKVRGLVEWFERELRAFEERWPNTDR